MKCKHFERRQVKPETRQEEMLQLWRDVAVGVASTDTAKDKKAPGYWASQVADDYAGYLLAIDKARGQKL
jgi:hypothetical protein